MGWGSGRVRGEDSIWPETGGEQLREGLELKTGLRESMGFVCAQGRKACLQLQQSPEFKSRARPGHMEPPSQTAVNSLGAKEYFDPGNDVI